MLRESARLPVELKIVSEMFDSQERTLQYSHRVDGLDGAVPLGQRWGFQVLTRRGWADLASKRPLRQLPGNTNRA